MSNEVIECEGTYFKNVLKAQIDLNEWCEKYRGVLHVGNEHEQEEFPDSIFNLIDEGRIKLLEYFNTLKLVD